MIKISLASAYAVMSIQNVIGLGLEPTRYAKLQSCIINTIANVFDDDDSLLFTNTYGLEHSQNLAKIFMNQQNVVAHFLNKYDAQRAANLFYLFLKWPPKKQNTFLIITYYGEHREVIIQTYKWICLTNFYNIVIIAYNDDFYPGTRVFYFRYMGIGLNINILRDSVIMTKTFISSLMFTQIVFGLKLATNSYSHLQNCVARTIENIFGENKSLLLMTEVGGAFAFPDTVTNPYVITNTYGLKHSQDVAKIFINDKNIVAHFRYVTGMQPTVSLTTSFSRRPQQSTILFITYATNQELIELTYKYLCLLKFYNVVLIVYDGSFYPTLIYIDQFAVGNQCGTKLGHFIIGDCNSTNTRQFFNVFRKYPNCKLTVRQPALINIDGYRSYPVTAQLILHTSAWRLNTTLRYSYATISDSSFDIYTTHISQETISELSTIPFFYDDIAWLVPPPKQISPLLILKIIFKPLIWVFVVMTLILTSLVWWLLANFFKPNSCFDIFFQLYSITVLGLINRVPLRPAFRLVFISYVIYAIHIQIAFTSKLAQILTIPQYEPHIKNLQELDDSNLVVFITEDLFEWLNETEITSPLHKRIYKKMVPLPVEDYREVVTRRDARNYSVFCLYDDYHTLKRYNRTVLNHFVDNSFSGSLKYVFIGNASVNIQPAFNLAVNYIIETGFVDYFGKIFNTTHTSFFKIGNPNSTVITMEHMCSIFIIWALGLIMAFAMFLIEIIIIKKTKQK
ncbi:hypothetical protein FQR65_LT15468 [Abscondita terminalis]|nr:hypothetical protein FQR65_LT15468 [Abscondita terminalis]